MSRRTIAVDKKKLQEAVNKAEESGPLKNFSALYVKVTEIYNAMPNIPESVTTAVVGLRVKQFKLKCVTVAGKKGRSPGFGGGYSGPRTTKAEKFKSSKQAQKSLKALKKNIPEERFAPIIARIEKGSRSAAVKMKCIECMGCQPSEVKKCTVIHCPLWLFRPYKEGETDTEGLETTEELVIEEAIA